LGPIVVLGQHNSAAASWFLLIYLVACTAKLARPWEGVAVFVAAEATLAAAALTGPRTVQDWTGWYLGVAAGAVAGWIWRSQGRTLAELRAAQGDLARSAAQSERQRIAREVHDVIAHSMAVTMLHLTAARMALRNGESQEAAESLAEAERVGRQSLADIRRTVDVLTPSEPDPTAAPLPGVGDIDALIAGYRDAGMRVGLTQDGDCDRVSAATGLGLYRIAQESLANAARHAPGSAVDVDLRIGTETVVLRVCNRGGEERESRRGADMRANGHGLRGMAERAGLLGGVLRAGPDGPAWLVEVQVPVEPAGNSRTAHHEPTRR
jgi:signal transduction histidine kinase